GDAHQAVIRQQCNSLIHFPALLERLEYVDLAFLPRPQRRRQVGYDRARPRPDNERQDDADKWQQQIDCALHARLWIGKDVAYFSGSAPSSVLSKSFTTCCSAIFVFAPSSFIASR